MRFGLFVCIMVIVVDAIVPAATGSAVVCVCVYINVFRISLPYSRDDCIYQFVAVVFCIHIDSLFV